VEEKLKRVAKKALLSKIVAGKDWHFVAYLLNGMSFFPLFLFIIIRFGEIG